MKYIVKYDGVNYQIDGDRFFNEQSEAFRNLWRRLPKHEAMGRSYAFVDDAVINVYERGGITVSMTGKEVNDGE